MAKRSMLNPDIDQVLLELTKENADRAPWLDEDGPDASWYDAFAEIDKTKTRDTTTLCGLLEKSDQELTPAIRHHIAGLLKRYTFKRKRGKQATPSYVLSGTNTRLWFQKFFMEGSDRNLSIEEAAKELATDEFSAETLIAAYQGKHGGFARAMKRAKK
jgi:hypothetical protein